MIFTLSRKLSVIPLLFSTLFVMILTALSCTLSGQKENSSSPTQPEEILPPTNDYFLDLAKISLATADGDTYDKENFTLNIATKWKCAQIWLGNYDASLYRYLRIEYEPVNRENNQPFRLHCRYSDDTSPYQLCERKRTVQYLALEKETC